MAQSCTHKSPYPHKQLLCLARKRPRVLSLWALNWPLEGQQFLILMHIITRPLSRYGHFVIQHLYNLTCSTRSQFLLIWETLRMQLKGKHWTRAASIISWFLCRLLRSKLGLSIESRNYIGTFNPGDSCKYLGSSQQYGVALWWVEYLLLNLWIYLCWGVG